MIQNKINICVVGGAGHIGLPISLVLAKKFKVSICDKNSNSINKIKNKIPPFKEENILNYLRNKKIINNLSFINDISEIQNNIDVVLLAVGTPVDEWGNPKLESLEKICFEVFKKLKTNGILILRSTVYPGFTNLIYNKIFKNSKKNIFYFPERIVQGHAFKEIFMFPQILGYEKITDAQRKTLKLILGTFSKKIIFCKTKEAELSKLFSNFWRYSTFAISNQMYVLSQKLGVSTSKVLKILKKDYDRASNIPFPGFAAGPCLYKDTKQLEFVSNNFFDVGKSSINMNEGLVYFVSDNLLKKITTKSKIFILGASFKSESDDFRDSLSFKVYKYLKSQIKNKIFIVDPYVKRKNILKNLKNIPISKTNDFFLIATPHKTFKKYLNLIKKNNIFTPWENFIE